MSNYVAAFEGLLTQKKVRNFVDILVKNHVLSQHGKARATRYAWID